MVSSLIKFNLDLVKRILFKLKGHKTGFQKDKFFSLEEIKDTQTYDNSNLIEYIFNKAKQARKISHYEQDSIIFNKPRPNKLFIDFLLYDYIEKIQLNKKIKVLDYGGSFGNTFFSLENYLNLKFDWNVFDQKKKIQLAKKTKVFKPVNFIYKHEIKKNYYYDIVLFSTSLQYMDDPLLVLKELRNTSKIILINNLILSDTKKNYLRIERPDPTIYNYTYPCWFLSKANFLNSLKDYYKITLNKTEEPYSLNDGENYYNLKLIKKR
jgi:putative methyltransferase (TIGR04325 family)